MGPKTPQQIEAQRLKHGSGTRNLNEDVNMWKTPMERDHHSSGPMGQAQLTHQANTWEPSHPAPQIPDGPSSSETGRTSRRLWSTPKDDHSYRQGTVAPSEGNGHGRTLGGDAVAFQGVKQTPRRLNPRFVEWLMGFPPGFTETP